MISFDSVARALLGAILNSLLPSLALAATAWLLLRIVPRTNAATRHLLWWAVLALVIVLPVATLVRRSLPRYPASPVSGVLPVVTAPIQKVVSSLPTVTRKPRLPLQLPGGKWLPAAAVAWFLFLVLHSFRIIWSFFHLRAMKRRAHRAPDSVRAIFQARVADCSVRRPVQALVSREILSPIATGFLHPAVILPEILLPQFQGPELDHAILHELAHVARRDDWTNLAGRCLQAVVGLHPVAAWTLRNAARERELACDDWVVSVTGEARPYAASLARLFELCGRRQTILAAGMAGSASHLGERIDTLLDRGRQFQAHASVIRMVVTMAALLTVVGIGLRTPRWVVLAQTPVRRPVGPSAAPAAPVNPRGSFLAAVVAAGYGDLSVEEIISLKEHGIDSAFMAGISQSGWSRMTAGELIELRNNGVSPEYLRQANSAGFRELTVRNVIALHAHGVSPEAIGAIHELEFGPYRPDQAIELSSHGVPPAWFRAARAAGITKVEVSEAISAFDRGVRANTFEAAGDYSAHLTLQQIVRLKQAGVIP